MDIEINKASFWDDRNWTVRSPSSKCVLFCVDNIEVAQRAESLLKDSRDLTTGRASDIAMNTNILLSRIAKQLSVEFDLPLADLFNINTTTFFLDKVENWATMRPVFDTPPSTPQSTIKEIL